MGTDKGAIMFKVTIALDNDDVTKIVETKMPSIPSIGSYLFLPGQNEDPDQYLVVEHSHKITPPTEIRVDGDLVREELETSDEVLILVSQVGQVIEEPEVFDCPDCTNGVSTGPSAITHKGPLITCDDWCSACDGTGRKQKEEPETNGFGFTVEEVGTFDCPIHGNLGEIDCPRCR